MEEELITQMGLILTQLRYTRRAIEDIERSTARYGGVAFATALQAGPRFGEPPLLAGALKVYIVNINDLAPGTGFGGFLESLLGGVGRFFGGFFGGLAGGAVGTIALLFGQLNRLASTIDRILDRLGLGGGTPRSTPTPPSSPPPAGTPPSSNLTAALPEIQRTIQMLTGLFTAASAGPDQAGRAAGGTPRTLGGTQWLEVLESVSNVLQGVARVVNGMILLVPILIGALALLVARLDNIKLAVIDLLQFVLRNVFLLRGVILVTIYDTIAAAASLAANILGTVGTLVSQVLTSIFRIVGALLEVAVESIRFLSNGIQNTIDVLLRWMVNALGAVLTFLGDTRIFRVIVHIIQTIPAIIPPLFQLITGSRLLPEDIAALNAAAARTIPGPTTPGGTVPVPLFPDLAATLTPPAGVRSLSDTLTASSQSITREVGGIFRSTTGALREVSATLQESAAQGEEGFTRGLAAHQATVVRRADELADALTSAQRAASEQPQTGLEAIARAYEGWLQGGGLRTILGNITEYFQGAATSGPEALRSLPGRITAQAAAERPRATIEIEEVVIEIGPAPEASRGTPSSPIEEADIDSLLDRLIQAWEERLQRGYQPGEGPSLAFA